MLGTNEQVHSPISTRVLTVIEGGGAFFDVVVR